MSKLQLESVHVGSHEFQFTAPDQLHFLLRGEFDERHVAPYLDFIFSRGAAYGGQFYAAYDLTKFTRITAGARQGVINVERPYPFAALAVIGASFSSRAIANMILTAGKILSPKHFIFPIHFVSTKSHADAWFDELRNKRG